jgi:hypothetical protein
MQAISQPNYLAVFLRHGSRFFRPKKPDGMLRGDSGASLSPALIFPGTLYAAACSGDAGYSMPAGTGAASYMYRFALCERAE